MIRYAVLIFNMLGLFFYQLFNQDAITVKQSAPPEMKPGTEYTIELTINKGTTGGFAKLQQDLPEGFTAEAGDSKGASFSFSGTSVKYIWTSLPSDPEFKISYKVKVAANTPAGEKELTGKFFYVADNNKQSVDIAPAKIKIIGDAVATNTTSNNTTTTTSATNTGKPVKDSSAAINAVTEAISAATGTNTNTQTNTNNTGTTTTNTGTTTTNTGSTNNTNGTEANNTGTKTPDNNTTKPVTTQAATAGGLVCTRKITPNGSDYNVELTVKRGNISGFAKLQENIPAGLTATALQSTGAAFSFADQKVKLVWVNLPNDAEFRIAYKLTGKVTTGNVDGVLSYIENDETKKYEINPTALSGTTTATVVAQNTTNNQNTTTTTTTNQNTTTTTNDPIKSENNTTTNNTTTTTANNNKPDLTQTTTPTANTAVNYKVQVCALRENRVESSYFANRFSLNGVAAELHEGWTKYTVGGFNEYKQARDYREDVRSKGVSGPFVTAYNSGKRITVQEALMITTQQWYK